jgi:hypothetical protein
MILIYVKTFRLNQDLKKVGKSCSGMSSAVFRTGLRAPHVVLGGALVPAGTVLVTPDLNNAPACTYYVITTLWNSVYLHSVVSSQGLGIGEKA